MENSAEKIGNNQDILTQLLLRLPTKSLLKFKCVSKKWLSIISDRQFCHSHTRRHQHNGFLEPTALLLRADFVQSPEFDVVPLKHYSAVPFFDQVSDRITLVNSCNGLFLCSFVNIDMLVRGYFICNPTTKKYKILTFPSNRFEGNMFYVNLAFDPLESPHYKIIAIRIVPKDYDFEEYEIDIYSSETDSWTQPGIRFEEEHGLIMFEDANIFCNGKIHWDSCKEESLCFDVKKECLQKMPMPAERSDKRDSYRCFGESRGILYIAKMGYYNNEACLELDVYEMAGDYSNWFLKHRLDFGDAFRHFPQLNLYYIGLCLPVTGTSFIQSEKGEEPKVVVWADGKIISYDCNDGAWNMLYDPGPGLKVGAHHLPSLELYLRDGIELYAFKYFENLSCF